MAHKLLDSGACHAEIDEILQTPGLAMHAEYAGTAVDGVVGPTVHGVCAGVVGRVRTCSRCCPAWEFDEIAKRM
ncbi:hypothetical protein QZH56_01190 [Streptomyces olivoreticuli]|uniref:hypothetical protein n=1 Tax=Streptomyces olivoreticuli TaxID=68246 RepID=UPI002659153A|nr:hypothetical protein [Streptomyces olivoreticuli]WKK24314.1 hypothetical protein QZH56_01190 [Streptomyces olivoreticuli]